MGGGTSIYITVSFFRPKIVDFSSKPHRNFWADFLMIESDQIELLRVVFFFGELEKFQCLSCAIG